MSATLVIGGARSGKSRFAEDRVSNFENVTYVATAPRYKDDREWSERIETHILRRPPHWQTVETLDLEYVIGQANKNDTLLIDCLTLWCTGQIDSLDAWQDLESTEAREKHTAALMNTFEQLAHSIRTSQASVVLVTNEVGQGVVPATASGRYFQDMMGILNITVAHACTEVWFVTAGIPAQLK